MAGGFNFKKSDENIDDKIKEIASFYLQCDIDDLELKGGYAVNKKTNSNLSIKKIYLNIKLNF